MFILSIFAVIILVGTQESAAEETWYFGEGLEEGDYFSYQFCHIDFKDCKEFKFEFWFEKSIQMGEEELWLVKFVVYDEDIVKPMLGDMEFSKGAPVPQSSRDGLTQYAVSFKSSMFWINFLADYFHPQSLANGTTWWISDIPFQNADPDGFAGPIGREIIHIATKAFDSTIVSNTFFLNSTDKFWIVDDFPYPMKGEGFRHGVKEFEFVLLRFDNLDEDPFIPVVTPEGGVSITIFPYVDHEMNRFVPDWVRDNAGWWSDGAITDNDFAITIEFMLNENTEYILEQRVPEIEPEIPKWIKNSAGWWAQGLISDQDFVDGIKYLVENEIIQVN